MASKKMRIFVGLCKDWLKHIIQASFKISYKCVF